MNKGGDVCVEGLEFRCEKREGIVLGLFCCVVGVQFDCGPWSLEI